MVAVVVAVALVVVVTLEAMVLTLRENGGDASLLKRDGRGSREREEPAVSLLRRIPTSFAS